MVKSYRAGACHNTACILALTVSGCVIWTYSLTSVSLSFSLCEVGLTEATSKGYCEVVCTKWLSTAKDDKRVLIGITYEWYLAKYHVWDVADTR